MKSEKGITLTSLIIYMIVLSIVIGVITMLTGYFEKNLKRSISRDTPEQYSRFTTYITNDINSEISTITVNNEGHTIDIRCSDSTSHQYLYNKNSIYYIAKDKDNNTKKIIRLCDEISNCTFSCNGDNLKISVTMKDRIYNNNYSI